jgi:small subunit ribosomal protein S5
LSGTNFTKQTEVQTESREKVFIEKVIFINRVTKVTKGGKNMAFSALVVVGDTDGSAGFALGKANEVAEAIKKGIKRAKKKLVAINRKDTTIPHEVYGHFGAVQILLKPASKGTGVIASSTIRSICECAGIHDILTKILKKSTNPINVVKATFMGFNQLKKA